MSFASESGYTPQTVQALMLSVMENVNTQFGTSYTEETFIGTNFYKYFYALIQKLQENEVKTSEIFLKLQDYFDLTNERISRPVVTNPGLIEALANAGYLASIKKPVDGDAGKIYICVDVDDTDPEYASTKLDICEVIKDSTVAGCVTQGTEVESIVLSNGQSFDFKFDLPNRIDTLLRLTLTLSENNQFVIESPEDVKSKLLLNIQNRYRLGLNFEPQKYFSLSDAPWCSKVLLEYSLDNGDNWLSDVYDADYDDLLDTPLENVTVIEE